MVAITLLALIFMAAAYALGHAQGIQAHAATERITP
jgi:hypothetical protein